MSAPEKSSVIQPHVRKLAIFAGGGVLPERLAQACEAQEIEIFIVAFDGQTNPEITKGRSHMLTRIGAAGQIIETLKSHGILDLVMIGAMRRPGLAELRPDLRTMRFFAKIGLKALGDDGLLKALRRELEDEGFHIHGVQDFVGDLIAQSGPVGRYRPRHDHEADIAFGISMSQLVGGADIGQSVIVQNGIVLGVEAAEGTDELIRRCEGYQHKGRGGILVKTAKPGQDRNLDLPTIGPETVLLCAQTGLEGIVLHAGASIIIEPEKIAEIADAHKIFVFGADIEKLAAEVPND